MEDRYTLQNHLQFSRTADVNCLVRQRYSLRAPRKDWRRTEPGLSKISVDGGIFYVEIPLLEDSSNLVSTSGLNGSGWLVGFFVYWKFNLL